MKNLAFFYTGLSHKEVYVFDELSVNVKKFFLSYDDKDNLDFWYPKLKIWSSKNNEVIAKNLRKQFSITSILFQKYDEKLQN